MFDDYVLIKPILQETKLTYVSGHNTSVIENLLDLITTLAGKLCVALYGFTIVYTYYSEAIHQRCRQVHITHIYL